MTFARVGGSEGVEWSGNRWERCAARMEAGLCPDCGTNDVQRVVYEGVAWLVCCVCNPDGELRMIHRVRPAADEHELTHMGDVIIVTRWPDRATRNRRAS